LWTRARRHSKIDVVVKHTPNSRIEGRPALQSITITAYAVHVEGAMWDDPRISTWCENLDDACAQMRAAEGFFASDEDGIPLLTIVRAEFSAAEWRQVQSAGWAFGVEPLEEPSMGYTPGEDAR
jgi:hypothetical protein